MATREDFLPWNNAGARDEKKRKLLQIVQTELTPIQRTIVTECIINDRSQTDVAKELGVNKSTVCRTLKKATAKIKRFAKYM